ncbi:MAG: hypothetical protein H8E80_04735 [Desulfobacteraceae bacterium]|uniref:Uncharacterized protein n=1 Tax=Candidatus Desulfaltia bathyphila TaxID=2841697 RepID=A0A8J6N7H0_9BACT|nr:hypothetical protein [Candidatus Desulfaltia bathyphila]MBL7195306.1 hypothetical protein [Desulfobacterales bacterium]
MKIALAHYHLKTGGVTTVLRQQIEAVKNDCEILVLTGELPDSPFPADIKHIPGLAYYGRSSQKIFNPKKVAESIIKAIHSKWKEGCNILHVHNPLLAKNKIFLKILHELRKREIRLFLQIHDFAEDGRPLSYFNEDEYVPDCHYGVINSRDYEMLLKAGLKKKGLHKIFNTIKPFEFKKKAAKAENFVLYPIRAIRRKNIGEAILLSLFFKNNEALFITQPPNSPIDIISYKGWKRFAEENSLDVVFEAGLKYDFEKLVLAARFLITTSITEGFGFSFLEPWTAKKILCGRKLPDICYDFEQNGIKLDHLYTKLLVPVKWIDKKDLYERWRASVLKACSLFNYKIDNNNIEKGFSAITNNNNIDFGLLDESFQKQIISCVLSDKKNANRLLSLNPYLSYIGEIKNKEDLIQNNMKAVLGNYNNRIYKKKLFEIYSNVCKNPVRQRIDKKILLSEFLNLQKFSLLKWGNYV